MQRNTSLRNLLRENRRLKEQLKALRQQMLYATLEQIINPRAGGELVRSGLKETCGFSFRSPYFCLMLLFNTPAVEQATGQMVMDQDGENWALSWDPEAGRMVNTQCGTWRPHWDRTVREIIEETVKGCLGRDHRADFYFLRADRDLCCLMNYETPGAIDTIIPGMNDAIEQLRQGYGLNMSAAVSQEKRGEFDLRDCYEECLMIHDYGWNLNMSVLTYDQLEMPIYSAAEFQPASSNTTQSIVMLERRFLNYVTMQAFMQASHTLNTLNGYLIERQRISLNRLVALTFHRLQNVLSICYTDLEPGDMRQVMNTLELIENIRSFPDLRGKTSEFFMQMEQAIQPRQQNDTDRAGAVIAYIEANYQNPNLGATMICENLHMSSTYLSRIMKQETGQGLVGAIHHVRLREAQQLLRNTELSLDQIAVHVGFTNRWILIRSFKNHMGMTPSDFRQSAGGPSGETAG